MTQETLLAALLENVELDRETVSRLKAADPEEMRTLLSQFLPAERVSEILARVRALANTLDDGP